MKVKKRLVSLVLAVSMLLAGFAMPQKANATEYPSRQYTCDGFNVEVKVTDEYENMFHGEVTLTNTGYDVIRDWTFSCLFGHKITNIWNAKVLSAENGVCVIANADWNQNIAPGATASFGFIAEKTESGEIVFPEGFSMGMKEGAVNAAEFGVEFVVYSDWGEGNTGALILKNLTDRRIHNWKLSFTYDREIVSISNAVVESYVNGVYTLRNADYNADLEPYGTVHISFNGGKGNGEAPAANFAMTETLIETVQPSLPVEPTPTATPLPTVTPEPTATPEPTPTPVVLPNVISGKVTEVVSGGAISGATVKVMQKRDVVTTATTDVNGVYSVSLYDGEYTLWVTKENYKTAKVDFVSKENAKGPDVVLKPETYKVIGFVAEKALGKPLAGVKVTVKNANGIVAETVTDKLGSYCFDLEYGKYTIVAEKEHYNTTEVAFENSYGVFASTIKMTQATYKLTGKVTDQADGKALSGVKVTVKNKTGIVTGAVTAEDGTYSVDLNHKEYRVTFVAENYKSRTLTVVGGEQESASVALEPVVPVEEDKTDSEAGKKPLPELGDKVPEINVDSLFSDYKSGWALARAILMRLFTMTPEQ